MAYNPSLNERFANHVERCYFGKAPTFRQANAAYGEATAECWWLAQLNEINKTSASKAMNGTQMEYAAQVMARAMIDFKVTEAILFLHRFRAQNYTYKFFGSVDVEKLLQCLPSFERERNIAIERENTRQLLERKKRWREECITYEEYLKSKMG